MAKNDGGAAFPRVGEGVGNPLYDHAGMSLRDYFAGQALIGMFGGAHREIAAEIASEKQAFCMTPTEIGKAAEEQIAYMAYSMADAMLAEREKGGA